MRSWLALLSLVACGREPPAPDAALTERVRTLEQRVADLERQVLVARAAEHLVPESSPVPSASEPVRIGLTLGGMTLDGKPIDATALDAALRERSARGSLPVTIDAAADVPHARIVETIDRVVALGGKVAIAARGGSMDVTAR